MAVPSLGAIAASFTVFLRAACLEKLPRASPEFNLQKTIMMMIQMRLMKVEPDGVDKGL